VRIAPTGGEVRSIEEEARREIGGGDGTAGWEGGDEDKGLFVASWRCEGQGAGFSLHFGRGRIRVRACVVAL
jgi:hypothetical protein